MSCEYICPNIKTHPHGKRMIILLDLISYPENTRISEKLINKNEKCTSPPNPSSMGE
jgi:hypothetical protein